MSKKNHHQNKRGLFVTFEGGEGSGKTTLIDRLIESLLKCNTAAIKTREPGGTPLGKKIRALLLEHPEEISKRAEILLFMADRAHHVDTLIVPALDAGDVVLCDRYIDSSFAYQGPYFEEEDLKAMMDFATGALEPDITFYLDVDPSIGFERAHGQARKLDKIEQRGLAFHEDVRRAFLKLSETYAHRFIVIDAMQSKDAVFSEVWHHLEKRLER